MEILVSAGEASGDRYAAELVAALKKRLPQARFFGCGGARLREQGLDAVIRTEDLAVVGLFEVVRHIPRIYRRFLTLTAEARRKRPKLAILTDSPDFHLRVAKKLHSFGVPVVYYVAPQVWAWRKGRVKTIRRLIDHLLVIFPFEEEFFRANQINATFVGHPLVDGVSVSTSRDEFLVRHGLRADKPLITLLPGSRRGESLRHLPALADAVRRLGAERDCQFALAASATTGERFFRENWRGPKIAIIEGETADVVGHADVAMVASGTATVETAMLETPMVTFYRLARPSYLLAKMLVDVPFYSMVNLLANREVVRELIQDECNGEKLAAETARLLQQESERCRMVKDFSELKQKLRTGVPAAERAAEVICEQYQLHEA